MTHARQQAWLAAIPKGSEKSRIQSLTDNCSTDNPPEIPLPDLEGAEFLVDFFHEAGIASQTGNGITSLSWQEILAWKSAREYYIPSWQILIIKKMSEAYCSQFYKSDDPRCKAPFITKPEQSRNIVQDKIANIFESLIQEQQEVKHKRKASI